MTTTVDAHPLDHAVPPSGGRLRRASAVGGGFLVAYALATIGGAPPALLTQIFNLPMVVLLVVAWWAVIAATSEIRALWLLLALAGTLWVAGSAGWAIEFERNHERVPTPPTVWDVPFALALVMTFVAVVFAIRGSIVVRHVALDALVISCAAAAVGTALAERNYDGSVTLRTVAALDRPFVGLLMLVLIASAALGSSEGVRRSTVLLGLAQVFLVTGHLIYSFQSLSSGRIDDRWCDLAWATGAVVSVLAAICVILDDDPLIRFGPPIRDSPHPRGSRTALGAGCCAIAASLLVVLYGALADRAPATIAGVVAGIIGVAGVALRGLAAFRSGDAAYVVLDRTLLENEQQRDQLAETNVELASANVQLRLYQQLLRGLLAEVDERSGGRLRNLVTDTTGFELREIDELND